MRGKNEKADSCGSNRLRNRRCARGGDRSSCEQYARRPVVPRARIRELRHQRRLLRRSTRKTRQSWSLALVQEGSRSIAGPFGSRTPGAFPKIEEAKSAAAPVGQLACRPEARRQTIQHPKLTPR